MDNKTTAVDHGPPSPVYANPPRLRKLHDPAVTFEEYHFYAKRTREEEETYVSPKMPLRKLFSREKSDTDSDAPAKVNVNIANPETRATITDEEWINASRAVRTASWGAVFYLITTDVLGPFAVPYAIGSLGYGPGIGVFTAFGVLAVYSGYLVHRVYMGVDSHEFRVGSYGDLAFRAWGTIGRHVVNVVQSLGLILLLGQVTILFGQNLSEISMYRLCYIVCPLLFVVVGFFLSQIRSLQNYGWIANFSFWANILAIIISMGAIAHNPPNYSISTLGSVGSGIAPDSIAQDAQGNYPPIQHFAGLPPQALIGSVNGILSGVLAWAGVQLFVEFMAEMRRPKDFLKSMFIAQFVIYVAYIVYGSFVYYYQGQYTFNPAYLGVSNYAWQTVGNVLTLISGLIAGGLYGNIGVKVCYLNVFVDIFGAPSLTSTAGKLMYAALVPIWWSIAFVIAASIPAYVYFVGVFSASTLVNLTYTIPPWMALGYDIQKNAIEGDGFDPSTGQVYRSDSGIRRLIRGFLSGGIFQVGLNIWHVLYFLGALGMCGLGMYAAITGMIEAFDMPQVNSFTCVSPLNLNS